MACASLQNIHVSPAILTSDAESAAHGESAAVMRGRRPSASAFAFSRDGLPAAGSSVASEMTAIRRVSCTPSLPRTSSACARR